DRPSGPFFSPLPRPTCKAGLALRTLVTFAGSLLMTLYKGPFMTSYIRSHKTSSHHESSSTATTSNQHWIAETLFIVLGCVWSCFYVLQQTSLSCLICLVGALQGSAVAFTVERRPSERAVGCDSAPRALRELAILCITKIIGKLSNKLSRIKVVREETMKATIDGDRGVWVGTGECPMSVTAFNPLDMIIISFLASIILAEKLHLGREKEREYHISPAMFSNSKF
ncbi:hypothetical protein DVH24_042741, partial [Malus domestica]